MMDVTNKYIRMIETALAIEKSLDNADFNLTKQFLENPDRLKYDIALLTELSVRLKQGKAVIRENVDEEHYGG